jgi:hypothetical protein
MILVAAQNQRYIGVMLTTNAQSQLAASMAQLLCSYALAANRTWVASALHGLSLWSGMLLLPGAHGEEHAPYASYRSGGGHAVAQVIVPGLDGNSRR